MKYIFIMHMYIYIWNKMAIIYCQVYLLKNGFIVWLLTPGE